MVFHPLSHVSRGGIFPRIFFTDFRLASVIGALPNGGGGEKKYLAIKKIESGRNQIVSLALEKKIVLYRFLF